MYHVFANTGHSLHSLTQRVHFKKSFSKAVRSSSASRKDCDSYVARGTLVKSFLQHGVVQGMLDQSTKNRARLTSEP